MDDIDQPDIFFKHHFQKNKDWNSPLIFRQGKGIGFKHHFQKNKDWNSDDDEGVSNFDKLFKHHFQKNKDWNLSLILLSDSFFFL